MDTSVRGGSHPNCPRRPASPDRPEQSLGVVSSPRLLFLSHRLPYAPNRGDRIRAFHLLRLLATRHDVDVVSLVHDAEEAAKASDLAGWVASVSCAQVHRRRRLVAGLASLPTSRPLTHVLLHSPDVARLIERVVRKTPPDVVVAFGSAMAQYVFHEPLARVPCLLDMVDVDSQKWADMGATGPFPQRLVYRRETRLLRRFERTAVDRAFATTVVNERELRLLDSVIGATRAIAVPNGVDLESFRPPGPANGEHQVVFCGVFNYEPNVEGAVWFASEVWPRVRQQEPRAKLVLVGAYPTAAVRALERESSIHVTGTVPDVRPFLWNGAVSVAPLRLARGLQNKVLEALAAGLPCVVTPQVFAGLPTCAATACREAETAAEFASATLDLLRLTPHERRAVVDNADLSSLAWNRQLAPMLKLVAERPLP